ncbi:MAG: hypothetical protein ACK559_32695, partial [bacterium]
IDAPHGASHGDDCNNESLIVAMRVHNSTSSSRRGENGGCMLEGSALGPEVRRTQAREKTREFNA